MAKKDAQGNLHDDSNGRFTSKGGTSELEKKYNDDLPIKPINVDGSVDDLKLQEIAKQKPEIAYGFANKERKGTAHHTAHAKEMGFKNQDEYERAACDFFNSDEGDLYYSERRKRFYRYDDKRHWMCVSSGGIIHTFMIRTNKEFQKTRNGDRLIWIK